VTSAKRNRKPDPRQGAPVVVLEKPAVWVGCYLRTLGRWWGLPGGTSAGWCDSGRGERTI